MIEDFKIWASIAAATFVGAGVWFKQQERINAQDTTIEGLAKVSRLTMVEKRVEDLEKSPVDTSQIQSNELAIKELQMFNAAAIQQRSHMESMIEKTQLTVEKQSEKQDAFQREMLQGLTRLSTELQERTKALHS